VLVETRGAFIDAAGGVAAGMSGSPVYLDHAGERALLGAIGYVFPDADGRLALVTPIEAMRTQTAGHASTLPAGRRPRRHAAAGRRARRPRARHARATRSTTSRRTRSRSCRQAAPARRPGPSGPLEPGSAFAIALVRGDVDLAAIGTVTEVVGDEVLALGHPFLGVGPSGWILAPASITAVVPSRRVPFKLGTVGSEVLGAVVADRPAGVAARLGIEPPLLPSR
jgi:hypothetical protein